MAVIRHDVEAQRSLCRVQGSVRATNWTGVPLVVALLQAPDSPGGPVRVADYIVLQTPGDFAFVLTPGRYRIAAFEDADGDLDFDVTERVAAYRNFEDTDFAPGSEIRSVELMVERTIETPQTMPEVEHPTGATRGFYFGDVVALNDPRFASATGQIGMLSPLRFMQEIGSSVFLTEPYDPARGVVVLVHGIGGYPQEFQALVDAIDRTQLQVWVVQYPSGFDLSLVAEHVAHGIREVSYVHHPSHICLVAHSMGGLVTRSALSRLADLGVPVPLFVTLASPLGGHPGAAMGVAFSPVVLPVWRSLDPHGAFIQHLYERPLDTATRYTLLFAYSSSDSGSDGVVPLTSQLRSESQAEAVMVRGFQTSHRGILEDAEPLAVVTTQLTTHCRADTN